MRNRVFAFSLFIMLIFLLSGCAEASWENVMPCDMEDLVLLDEESSPVIERDLDEMVSSEKANLEERVQAHVVILSKGDQHVELGVGDTLIVIAKETSEVTWRFADENDDCLLRLINVSRSASKSEKGVVENVFCFSAGHIGEETLSFFCEKRGNPEERVKDVTIEISVAPLGLEVTYICQSTGGEF